MKERDILAALGVFLITGTLGARPRLVGQTA